MTKFVHLPTPLEIIKHDWELTLSRLPPEPTNFEQIIANYPTDKQELLRQESKKIHRIKEEIEQRIACFARLETPGNSPYDPQSEIWHKLLIKITMLGWIKGDDFERLEGFMPLTWPGKTPHHSLKSWLPFLEWCHHFLAEKNRIIDVLLIKTLPEFATLIADKFHTTIIFESDHYVQLTNLLNSMRIEPGSTQKPVSIGMAQTNINEIILLKSDQIQSLMIGETGWKLWSSTESVLRDWMLFELSKKVLYFAIESSSPVNLSESSGWVIEKAAPENTRWWFFKSNYPRPWDDVKTEIITSNSDGIIRRQILKGKDFLIIKHLPTHSLTKEYESWNLIKNRHAMLPVSTRMEQSQENMFLELLLESKYDYHNSPNLSLFISLFYLLHITKTWPRNLNSSDFFVFHHGIFLTRIGFNGYHVTDNPLISLITICDDFFRKNEHQLIIKESNLKLLDQITSIVQDSFSIEDFFNILMTRQDESSSFNLNKK